ncbi:hypothetical protein I79_017584 [Cricetulus griseus]|uniref:Uncharacterized protein n=1 Tax=Cricetulus griseus TaxID=10029 RepID=G3I2H7_CRIGR|nr:hypothetical protein I79_017584 [Cricetulus griseus]
MMWACKLPLDPGFRNSVIYIWQVVEDSCSDWSGRKCEKGFVMELPRSTKEVGENLCRNRLII